MDIGEFTDVSADGHARKDDNPQQCKDQPAQGKQPEARHDTIARQMHVAMRVSENDVGPGQNERQYSGLPGQECDDDDDVEKYRGLEEIGQMSGMNPKVVGLVAVPVQPEEFGIDLAFPDRRKPQPCKTKKAEGGQSKHRKDGIENIHSNELLGRTAEPIRDAPARVGRMSEVGLSCKDSRVRASAPREDAARMVDYLRRGALE